MINQNNSTDEYNKKRHSFRLESKNKYGFGTVFVLDAGLFLRRTGTLLGSLLTVTLLQLTFPSAARSGPRALLLL